MKRIFLPLMLMILLLTGCGGDDSKIVNSMKYQRLITIGIDDEFPPMGFRNEKGEIVGFDVDLAKEAARRIGYEIEFKPIDWSKKETEMASGNIDMIWNGCDITEERKEYMIFSKPYMDNRQILLVKTDRDFDITSEYDLAGKIVGTQAGSNSEDYVNENGALKNSFRDFKTYHSYVNAFNALDDGELDVLIVDELVGRYEILKNSDNFEMVEATIGSVTEIGIAFRKDNIELRNKVQSAFDDMIKDGTAQKISMDWFQADLIK